jgi:hypothetical protein
MPLKHKIEIYSKEGLGLIGLMSVRLPFRIFSMKPYKVMFKPDFDGAKFYYINLEAVDIEHLLKFENPYEAMSYLRNIENFEIPEK